MQEPQQQVESNVGTNAYQVASKLNASLYDTNEQVWRNIIQGGVNPYPQTGLVARPALMEDLVDARAALTPRRTDASQARLNSVALTNALGNNFGTNSRGKLACCADTLSFDRESVSFRNFIFDFI